MSWYGLGSWILHLGTSNVGLEVHSFVSRYPAILNIWKDEMASALSSSNYLITMNHLSSLVEVKRFWGNYELSVQCSSIANGWCLFSFSRYTRLALTALFIWKENGAWFKNSWEMKVPQKDLHGNFEGIVGEAALPHYPFYTMISNPLI